MIYRGFKVEYSTKFGYRVFDEQERFVVAQPSEAFALSWIDDYKKKERELEANRKERQAARKQEGST